MINFNSSLGVVKRSLSIESFDVGQFYIEYGGYVWELDRSYYVAPRYISPKDWSGTYYYMVYKERDNIEMVISWVNKDYEGDFVAKDCEFIIEFIGTYIIWEKTQNSVRVSIVVKYLKGYLTVCDLLDLIRVVSMLKELYVRKEVMVQCYSWYYIRIRKGDVETRKWYKFLVDKGISYENMNSDIMSRYYYGVIGGNKRPLYEFSGENMSYDERIRVLKREFDWPFKKVRHIIGKKGEIVYLSVSGVSGGMLDQDSVSGGVLDEHSGWEIVGLDDRNPKAMKKLFGVNRMSLEFDESVSVNENELKKDG